MGSKSPHGSNNLEAAIRRRICVWIFSPPAPRRLLGPKEMAGGGEAFQFSPTMTEQSRQNPITLLAKT